MLYRPVRGIALIRMASSHRYEGNAPNDFPCGQCAIYGRLGDLSACWLNQKRQIILHEQLEARAATYNPSCFLEEGVVFDAINPKAARYRVA